MFKIKYVLLFGFLTIFNARAQNYLWPTSASKHMSSSFCEYRPAHYHSAIDIKTWNREGYPVFAVDDGQIYRIRISPFGYGKVMYLKLKDGRFAVYAHLKKFIPKIEKALQAQQLKKMRYSIDWYPENWKVKRGELLAYTGQTGIGVPHLHFEIRDSLQHPLNPLVYYRNEIKDNIAPILQELMIIPLTAQSTVNGSHLPHIFPLTKGPNHTYRLKDSLSAHGTIGLALRSYDMANGVYNKFTFYRTHLFWDGKEVFNVSYDTLYFSKTHLADVEVYYPFKTLLHKRFRKLFIEPFNTLPFYHHSPGNGYLKMQGKSHHFRLVVRDFFGNTSVVRARIQNEMNFNPDVQFAGKSGYKAYLKFTIPSSVQNIAFWSSVDGNHWLPINYFEVLEHVFSAGGMHTFVIKADIRDSNATYLRAEFSRAGSTQHICFVSLNDSCAVPGFKWMNMGKRFLAVTDSFFCCQNLNVAVQTKSGMHSLTPDVHRNHAEIVLPAPETQDDFLHFTLRHSDSAEYDTTFQYYTLFPGKAQNFSFFNNRLQLHSGRKTVYDTLLFTLQKSDTIPVVKGIPTLSPVFAFNWYPQIFRKAATLTLRIDSVSVHWRQLGFGKIGHSGHLSFIGGQADSARKSIRARIKTLGHFILIADTTAPKLKILQPATDAILSKLKEIRISLDDTLSGIDSDRNIRIFIDNKQLIPEWDPERHLVVAHPYWKLKPGQHKINVTVVDLAGNRANKNAKFSIQIKDPE